MVKIRYATTETIMAAIEATSNKFDGNIVSNRFEQVDNHYEVTIKCVSSRGKGAKRGTTGRRTSSCCWHAWGTFFEELFRLNPNIVVIAMGQRITATSGNWIDRTAIPSTMRRESEMCDCEANGWVRNIEAHSVAEHAEACGVRMPEEGEPQLITAEEHERAYTSEPLVRCDTCIHSHLVTGRMCNIRDVGTCYQGSMYEEVDAPNTACVECIHVPARTGSTCPHDDRHLCLIYGGQHRMFERYVPSVRNCDTCRYSSMNTSNHSSQCPVGRCLTEEGLQNWAQYNPTTFRDAPNTSCELCVYSSTRRGVPCQHYLDSVCLIDNQHRKFERFVSSGQPRHAVCLTCHHNRDGGCMNSDDITTIPIGCPHALRKECNTCRYNWDENGVLQRCHPVIGLCTSHLKWAPIITPVIVEGTPESRYDIPLGVEHGTQVEQLVLLPVIEEE